MAVFADLAKGQHLRDGLCPVDEGAFQSTVAAGPQRAGCIVVSVDIPCIRSLEGLHSLQQGSIKLLVRIGSVASLSWRHLKIPPQLQHQFDAH